jgi:hypothetical protein
MSADNQISHLALQYIQGQNQQSRESLTPFFSIASCNKPFCPIELESNYRISKGKAISPYCAGVLLPKNY